MSNRTVGLYSNTGNTPTEDALKHVINHQFDWLINCQGTILVNAMGSEYALAGTYTPFIPTNTYLQL